MGGWSLTMSDARRARGGGAHTMATVMRVCSTLRYKARPQHVHTQCGHARSRLSAAAARPPAACAHVVCRHRCAPPLHAVLCCAVRTCMSSASSSSSYRLVYFFRLRDCSGGGDTCIEVQVMEAQSLHSHPHGRLCTTAAAVMSACKRAAAVPAVPAHQVPERILAQQRGRPRPPEQLEEAVVGAPGGGVVRLVWLAREWVSGWVAGRSGRGGACGRVCGWVVVRACVRAQRHPPIHLYSSCPAQDQISKPFSIWFWTHTPTTHCPSAAAPAHSLVQQLPRKGPDLEAVLHLVLGRHARRHVPPWREGRRPAG